VLLSQRRNVSKREVCLLQCQPHQQNGEQRWKAGTCRRIPMVQHPCQDRRNDGMLPMPLYQARSQAELQQRQAESSSKTKLPKFKPCSVTPPNSTMVTHAPTMEVRAGCQWLQSTSTPETTSGSHTESKTTMTNTSAPPTLATISMPPLSAGGLGLLGHKHRMEEKTPPSTSAAVRIMKIIRWRLLVCEEMLATRLHSLCWMPTNSRRIAIFFYWYSTYFAYVSSRVRPPSAVLVCNLYFHFTLWF